MEYLHDYEEQIGNILCCQCGVPIKPNPSNMCVGCLRTHVDITEGIPKQMTIYFCKGCERYLQPPTDWVSCALESRELLTVCLNKIKCPAGVKLVDAGFVWTEPHSRRIKVKITVQGEVLGGTMLQQVFIVEYTVANQMCDSCHRVEAQDFWRALVQVRQKAENKKTLFYLEQLILKHRAHAQTLGIKQIHEGLDFFFATEANARKMVDFLNSVLPCRYQHSKKLISHDIHSNIYNYKFTYSVEIVPLSKDSVVCLPKKLTHQLGGIGSICLVFRISSAIHLIDPMTAQIAELSSTVYWRYPFNSICNPKQLVEYVVMDIEPIKDKDRRIFPGQGTLSHKHMLSDVWVVKSSEIGLTNNTIHTRTHLGHILKPGDSALGYALADSNLNDEHFEKLETSAVPDVVLVKKYYGDHGARKRNRIWKLKHLAEDDANFNTGTKDYDEFLDDLEEDPTLRQNVNVFRDTNRTIPVDRDDYVDDDIPFITLEEMLDDMQLEDVEMADSGS